MERELLTKLALWYARGTPAEGDNLREPTWSNPESASSQRGVHGTPPSRKPLVLRGARQVGKSTLVRLFAQKHNLHLVEVNIEEHADLGPIFRSQNIDKILTHIKALPEGAGLNENSLLFLDEIQALPEAFSTLRYFYEKKPQLAVICAGSLLELALMDRRYSMPVGRVEYLYIGPMTWLEFLQALNEDTLIEHIKNFRPGDNIENLIHQRLLDLLKVYFFVGGMPEAVQAYVQTRDLAAVEPVAHALAQTFQDDFPKYISAQSLHRVTQVLDTAAQHAGEKIKYSNYSKTNKSSVVERDIEVLCMSRLLAKVWHSHCNGLPLQADLKPEVYKLFLLDVGLLNALRGLQWQEAFSLKQNFLHRGVLAEQFVAQHLQHFLHDRLHQKLTYWLREGASGAAEVDFVFSQNNCIWPIEVKSGASGRLRSLHQLMGTKGFDRAVRFDTSLPSVQDINTTVYVNKKPRPARYQLISLPLYLISQLKQF